MQFIIFVFQILIYKKSFLGSLSRQLLAGEAKYTKHKLCNQKEPLNFMVSKSMKYCIYEFLLVDYTIAVWLFFNILKVPSKL